MLPERAFAEMLADPEETLFELLGLVLGQWSANQTTDLSINGKCVRRTPPDVGTLQLSSDKCISYTMPMVQHLCCPMCSVNRVMLHM